jgi:hypothetical protein
VVRLEPEERPERVPAALGRFARDADHEVDGHRLESGFAGGPAEPRGLRRRIRAPQGAQDPVIEGLDADAQPGHPGFAPAAHEAGRRGGRMGLEREFRDVRGEPALREAPDPGDVIRSEKGRRSPAEIEGIDQEPGSPGRPDGLRFLL